MRPTILDMSRDISQHSQWVEDFEESFSSIDPSSHVYPNTSIWNDNGGSSILNSSFPYQLEPISPLRPGCMTIPEPRLFNRRIAPIGSKSSSTDDSEDFSKLFDHLRLEDSVFHRSDPESESDGHCDLFEQDVLQTKNDDLHRIVNDSGLINNENTTRKNFTSYSVKRNVSLIKESIKTDKFVENRISMSHSFDANFEGHRTGGTAYNMRGQYQHVLERLNGHSGRARALSLTEPMERKNNSYRKRSETVSYMYGSRGFFRMGMHMKQEKCGYCHSVGNNDKHSRFSCPALAKLNPCRICGASGVNNHTEMYCPAVPKVILQLNPSFIAMKDAEKAIRIKSISS